MVHKGTFRRDLYHRLNVIQIVLPPLRKRREDIPLLTEYFLKHYTAKLGLSSIPDSARASLEAKRDYDWPGNVRELENETQRALILGENKTGLARESDSVETSRNNIIQVKVNIAEDRDYQQLQKEVMSKFCKEFFDFMLYEHQGNITNIARSVGMRRTSVQRLIKRHGLNPHYYRKNTILENGY
jgi:DNA-binding NtrC family response regulator